LDADCAGLDAAVREGRLPAKHALGQDGFGLDDELCQGDPCGGELLTPLSGEVSAGLVCFNVAGMKDTEVVARLKEKKIIASTTPRVYGVDCARFAPSLLTSPADVEACLRAVRALA
jgi:hypothetical protein